MSRWIMFCVVVLAGVLSGCDSAAVDRPAPSTNVPPPSSDQSQLKTETVDQ